MTRVHWYPAHFRLVWVNQSMGDPMKFLTPNHAPDGLTSYARVNRVRPGLTLLNIVEGLFGIIGVVIVILAIRYGGSFEKAGLAIDQTIHGACAAIANAAGTHGK
jgi:hypothetical protein